MGDDVAGTVVEVGTNVKRIRVGDRVIGHSAWLTTDDDRTGGFQLHTVVKENLTVSIQDTLSLENAVVLPIGVSTAATALFSDNHLGLQHPYLSPDQTGQTVLIWGGTTSVGCNAIQFAVAAGYKVITTASPKHFDRDIL
jgi:NADPH:quinone reductase-like Zn-dependent oxidoreductase